LLNAADNRRNKPARPDPAKDVHLRWKSIAPLKVGDVIQVKVLDVAKADRPKSRQNATRKRAAHL